MNATQFTPRLLSSCARVNAALLREQADDLAHTAEYTKDCALVRPDGQPVHRVAALYEPASLREQGHTHDLRGMPTLAWVNGARVYMPTTYESFKAKRRVVVCMSAY